MASKGLILVRHHGGAVVLGTVSADTKLNSAQITFAPPALAGALSQFALKRVQSLGTSTFIIYAHKTVPGRSFVLEGRRAGGFGVVNPKPILVPVDADVDNTLARSDAMHYICVRPRLLFLTEIVAFLYGDQVTTAIPFTRTAWNVQLSLPGPMGGAVLQTGKFSVGLTTQQPCVVSPVLTPGLAGKALRSGKPATPVSLDLHSLNMADSSSGDVGAGSGIGGSRSLSTNNSSVAEAALQVARSLRSASSASSASSAAGKDAARGPILSNGGLASAELGRFFVLSVHEDEASAPANAAASDNMPDMALVGVARRSRAVSPRTNGGADARGSDVICTYDADQHQMHLLQELRDWAAMPTAEAATAASADKVSPAASKAGAAAATPASTGALRITRIDGLGWDYTADAGADTSGNTAIAALRASTRPSPPAKDGKAAPKPELLLHSALLVDHTTGRYLEVPFTSARFDAAAEAALSAKSASDLIAPLKALLADAKERQSDALKVTQPPAGGTDFDGSSASSIAGGSPKAKASYASQQRAGGSPVPLQLTASALASGGALPAPDSAAVQVAAGDVDDDDAPAGEVDNDVAPDLEDYIDGVLDAVMDAFEGKVDPNEESPRLATASATSATSVKLTVTHSLESDMAAGVSRSATPVVAPASDDASPIASAPLRISAGTHANRIAEQIAREHMARANSQEVIEEVEASLKAQAQAQSQQHAHSNGHDVAPFAPPAGPRLTASGSISSPLVTGTSSGWLVGARTASRELQSSASSLLSAVLRRDRTATSDGPGSPQMTVARTTRGAGGQNMAELDEIRKSPRGSGRFSLTAAQQEMMMESNGILQPVSASRALAGVVEAERIRRSTLRDVPMIDDDEFMATAGGSGNASPANTAGSASPNKHVSGAAAAGAGSSPGSLKALVLGSPAIRGTAAAGGAGNPGSGAAAHSPDLSPMEATGTPVAVAVGRSVSAAPRTSPRSSLQRQISPLSPASPSISISYEFRANSSTTAAGMQAARDPSTSAERSAAHVLNILQEHHSAALAAAAQSEPAAVTQSSEMEAAADTVAPFLTPEQLQQQQQGPTNTAEVARSESPVIPVPTLRSAPPLLREELSADPLDYTYYHHVGTVTKRGHVFTSWRRRWFVLDGPKVLYYVDIGLDDYAGMAPTPIVQLPVGYTAEMLIAGTSAASATAAAQQLATITTASNTTGTSGATPTMSASASAVPSVVGSPSSSHAGTPPIASALAASASTGSLQPLKSPASSSAVGIAAAAAAGSDSSSPMPTSDDALSGGGSINRKAGLRIVERLRSFSEQFSPAAGAGTGSPAGKAGPGGPSAGTDSPTPHTEAGPTRRLSVAVERGLAVGIKTINKIKDSAQDAATQLGARTGAGKPGQPGKPRPRNSSGGAAGNDPASAAMTALDDEDEEEDKEETIIDLDAGVEYVREKPKDKLNYRALLSAANASAAGHPASPKATTSPTAGPAASGLPVSGLSRSSSNNDGADESLRSVLASGAGAGAAAGPAPLTLAADAAGGAGPGMGDASGGPSGAPSAPGSVRGRGGTGGTDLDVPLAAPIPPAHTPATGVQLALSKEHAGRLRGMFTLGPYSRAWAVNIVGHPHAFCVTTTNTDKPFLCAAPSEAARSEWVRVIQHNVRVRQRWERRKLLWKAAMAAAAAAASGSLTPGPSAAELTLDFGSAPNAPI